MITIAAYLVGTVLGFYFGKFHERAVWDRDMETLIQWAESKVENLKDGE